MSRRTDRVLLGLAAILLALPAGVAAADPTPPAGDRPMAAMHGAMMAGLPAGDVAACAAMHGSMASTMGGASSMMGAAPMMGGGMHR